MAAKTMVIIQKRTVILASWNTFEGHKTLYVHPGSNCASVVLK